ncbi:two-pore potassium channel 5-like isoform X2 [Olea europaea var. sylvestris]|uniref:two-pore potassium channel 5-like isoform X1 n=1 Tax=Olea europaea var. sylvestris TaxID=158386 RepID=UPI000C1D3C98|nr:two-pore potassium channel 5-like isoform X1 [Olea europaea var. sylvestris]XP_022853166.1 two-pore potassium channel 5-like isoform X2 [Olea europaea var. sylvestris]
MAAEPLLAPPQAPRDFTLKIPRSLKRNDIKPHPPVIYEDIEDGPLSDDDLVDTVSPPPGPSSSFQRKKIQRCKTAPAMSVMKDLQSDHAQDPDFETQSVSLVRQAAVLLLIYLALGLVIYSLNRDNFSGVETHPVVDALYFCIVTMCTIGYGDIAPLTPATKVFACVFVLVGFGFIDILLSGVVNYVLDLQESVILAGIQAHKQDQQKEHGRFSARDYIVDVAKGRMRIRLKVGLALGVVVLCIGIGAMVLYFVEHLDWVDSVYLSVMSVTTVGYGDRAFKTLPGRLFASIWLLFSTLAVARAFLYLAEARMDKRHRKITNWVLHRKITVEDLVAADINNNGFISKSEYIIYKLKEMGKIREKDIIQICEQFSKLDPNNSGKISLPNLLESHL